MRSISSGIKRKWGRREIKIEGKSRLLISAYARSLDIGVKIDSGESILSITKTFRESA